MTATPIKAITIVAIVLGRLPKKNLLIPEGCFSGDIFSTSIDSGAFRCCIYSIALRGQQPCTQAFYAVLLLLFQHPGESLPYSRSLFQVQPLLHWDPQSPVRILPTAELTCFSVPQ